MNYLVLNGVMEIPMGKVIIDRKDNKFVISIIPYLENTFVIDDIEITEEAKDALFKGETSCSSTQEFTKR